MPAQPVLPDIYQVPGQNHCEHCVQFGYSTIVNLDQTYKIPGLNYYLNCVQYKLNLWFKPTRYQACIFVYIMYTGIV